VARKTKRTTPVVLFVFYATLPRIRKPAVPSHSGDRTHAFAAWISSLVLPQAAEVSERTTTVVLFVFYATLHISPKMNMPD